MTRGPAHAHTTFQRAYSGDLIITATLNGSDQEPKYTVARVVPSAKNEDKLTISRVECEQRFLDMCSPELLAWLDGVTHNPKPLAGLLPAGCGWDGVNTAVMRAIVAKLRKFVNGVTEELYQLMEEKLPNSRGIGKQLAWPVSRGVQDKVQVTRLTPTISGLIPITSREKPFSVVIFYDNTGKVIEAVYPRNSELRVPENVMRAAVFCINANEYKGKYDGMTVQLYSRKRDVSKLSPAT